MVTSLRPSPGRERELADDACGPRRGRAPRTGPRRRRRGRPTTNAAAAWSSTTSKPRSSESTSGVDCAHTDPGQPAQEGDRHQHGAGDHQPPARRARRRRTGRPGSRSRSPHPLCRSTMATMPSDPAAAPRAGLRLMHVHAHPDDESSKGAASTAMYVAAGRRRPRRHLHGRRARVDPEPEDGPPRDRGEHHRGPPPGDGAGPRHPRRAPGLAGLRRLGLARRRPQAPAAGGLLRAGAARGGGRAAGPADARVPAARRHDVRRARRLPAPRPRDVPPGVGRGVRGGRRPGALPRRWASPGSRSSSTTTTRSTGPGCRPCTRR